MIPAIICCLLLTPAGAQAQLSAQARQEWEKISQTASKLALDNKAAEAIAMVEKFAVRTPNFWEPPHLLATFYEQRANTPGARNDARRRDLEAAVKHAARAVELVPDRDLKFVIMWKLVRLYGPDELSRPRDAERYARTMVEQFPTRAEAHMELARIRRDEGDIAGAAEIMRKGRAASAMPVAGLMLAVQYLIEQVQSNRALPRGVALGLLAEANSVADAMLAHPDRDDRDYRLATMAKGMAIELQAGLATDRRQRIALLLEAERWGAPIDAHKNGKPPAARKLSASDTADLEFRAMSRWNVPLLDEGKIDDVIAAHERYLKDWPKFHEAHSAIADLHLRAAREAKTAQARLDHVARAALHFEHLIELAPTVWDRDAAFLRVLDLYGPAELERPAKQESLARAMIKRQPGAAVGYYALAAVLLRTDKSAEAEKVLRDARAAIKPTAPSRGTMASELVLVVRGTRDLPAAVGRRLFDEADALLREAEKINGNALEVIEARMSWLHLSADRFEKDATRAEAQRERAKQLSLRAEEIRLRIK